VTPGFWRSVVTGVLVLLALGHVPASRLAAAERTRSVVGLLEQPYRAGGSDPLVTGLREALGDRDLRVLPWDAVRGGYVDASGTARPIEPGWIEVRDAELPVAAVASGSPLLTDALTERQVADAVRLTIRARHRQAEREAQVAELEAARRRLLDAADAERQLVADRLQSEVLPYLRGATAALAGLRGSDVLTVVGDELGSAESDLGRLVDGVPPADLGGGRLVAALEDVGRRTHLPVTVTAQPGWGLDAAAEQTLYYVASEALANVLKHARASTVTIVLRTEGDDTVLDVRDDGVGGADPHGLGLLGLADRVATRGGVLTVTSPPGAGTTLTARIPRLP
jgi:signal transduction histidine kinase